MTTTTSQEQGQTREGMSGGSWRQICEPTNRNIIEGARSLGQVGTTQQSPLVQETQ
ncbi:hypothetical protein ACQ4M3_19875 [Leptolyngbya sp. AN03gr2]|uniref:hypothetical protein n=1 Tax=Leptolyngbya sp. AN03gr2 TaxID=3423364 RepID=UPI003D31E22A